MVIIAIDPGKTTGCAVLSDDGTFKAYEYNFDDTCRTLISAATTYGADLELVSESFIITVNTAKNSAAPWSLELIGVARMVSHLYTGKELVLQPPVNAKRFSSNDRLKRMGWWTPGKGHANDAARHLLYRRASTGGLPVETLQELAVAGLE